MPRGIEPRSTNLSIPIRKVGNHAYKKRFYILFKDSVNKFTSQIHSLSSLFRWLDAVVTPDPIPNSEVKRRRTDGTPYGGRVGSRRNRELKLAFKKVLTSRAFFLASVREPSFSRISSKNPASLLLVAWVFPAR